MANVHLAAVEHGRDIVFLHAVSEGPASRSYGLQVARLAGVPHGVIRSAEKQLAALEAAARDGQAQRNLFDVVEVAERSQDEADQERVATDVLDALAALDPDALAPRDALDALYRLKRIIQGDAPR